MVNLAKKFRGLLSLSAVLLLAFSVFMSFTQTAQSAFNVNFTNFWLSGISPGSGYIGVDIWWPNGGSDYNPCHHSNDAFYGACELSNNGTASYYKVHNYTPSSTDFPYGIFIDNSNTNRCKTAPHCNNPGANSFNHGWGRLISDGSLEVYPIIGGVYNPSINSVGGVRVKSDFFIFANGGRYSKNLGRITLPQLGNPGVGKLNGFATNNGTPVANQRVALDVFQLGWTGVTTTGIPQYGFSSVKNNSDAYYSTGPLPTGVYKIYVTDTQTNHKIILDGVGIRSAHERFDFRLEQPCFGFATNICTDPAN